MARLPNVTWLRSFLAAANHLSFTRAAAELGLTQTAVSLHVRSLESVLGTSLFIRNARRLTLTQNGESYSYSLRQAFGDISFSTDSLFGPAAKGAITVSVPFSTAGLWLANRLPDFRHAYPGIMVKLVSPVWSRGSTDSEKVDVELRFGNGNWGGFRAKRISRENIVTICALGMERSIEAQEALLTGPIVQILGFEDFVVRYLEAHNKVSQLAAVQYVVDTTVAAVDIVVGGAAFAVVLERFAQTAIATGKRIAIIGKPVPIKLSHYLITDDAFRTKNPSVHLFEEWLAAKFAESA